jgi:hypothetical protein
VSSGQVRSGEEIGGSELGVSAGHARETERVQGRAGAREREEVLVYAAMANRLCVN